MAAWFVLDIVPTERVPWWAAQWLTDGYDGPALRELAGLDGSDPRAVSDLLPAALADMAVTLPSSTLAAVGEAFRRLAEMCVSGRAGERWVAQQVEDVVVRSDFDAEVMGLPLAQLYGTEDAWQGGWGPSIEELRATVRDRCAAQLQPPRAGRRPTGDG